MMLNQGLFSSEKQDWCTPQQFFNELDAEFHFVLNAAATHQSSKCKRCFTPEDDGLIQSWDVGAVYCNPPYGKEIGLWVKKAYEEAQKGVTIVMLIPARTDTKYFHEYIYHKAEIRFVKGRLKFTDENGTPKGTAPFPSMVVIYNRKDNQ